MKFTQRVSVLISIRLFNFNKVKSWNWRVSRAEPMLLYWPKMLYPYYSLLFSFSSLSIGWYCGAGVFGLIGCISLSPSLALLTFFNNNNNNNKKVTAWTSWANLNANATQHLCLDLSVHETFYNLTSLKIRL